MDPVNFGLWILINPETQQWIGEFNSASEGVERAKEIAETDGVDAIAGLVLSEKYSDVAVHGADILKFTEQSPER